MAHWLRLWGRLQCNLLIDQCYSFFLIKLKFKKCKSKKMKETTKTFWYVILVIVTVVVLVYAAIMVMPRGMKRRLFPRNQFGDKIVVSADQTMGAINSSVSLNEHGDVLVATMKIKGIRTVVVMKRNDTKKTYDVQQQLVPSSQTVPANAGNLVAALSADGNTIIAGIQDQAGGQGKCWVFKNSNNTWTESANILGTGATGNAGQGNAVAISGDGRTMAVGGQTDDSNTGAVWVFYDNVQVGQKLVAASATNKALPGQGYAVALTHSGRILAVGSLGDSGGVGAVFVYASSASSSWKLLQKIVGSGMLPVNPTTGVTAFGGSISLSRHGDYMVVGAANDDNGNGSVFTFKKEHDTDAWHQQGHKEFPKYGVFDNENIAYGNAVALSLDGEILAASANNDENVGGTDSIGATWILMHHDHKWKLENKLVGTGYVRKSGAGVSQGNFIALSGDGKTLAVVGSMDDSNIGAIWVFVH